MIDNKYHIFSINKETLYITIIKTSLIEIFLFIIGAHIYLIFNIFYTFDFINIYFDQIHLDI